MKKIGIAVIGASKRSSMIFHFMKNHPHQGFITGCYDPIAECSRHYLDHYQPADAVVYESLDQAVNDPRVDAIFIGTPDNEHVEPTVAALKAGKHVYCEKPLAITLQDCDTMIQAARQADTVFYLGMNLRHGPVHETIHRAITSGRLGQILTIEANEYYVGGRTYFRRWNRLREHGGGLWITKATHDFDLLNWMAGGKPVRVYATCELSHYHKRPEAASHCRICPIKESCRDYYDVEEPFNSEVTPDFARLAELVEQATGEPRDICLFNSNKDTFDNGIAVVDYDSGVRATYTVNVVSARSTRQMRVMGTEASLEGDMEEGLVHIWPRFSRECITHDLREKMKSGHGGADDQILKDFLRCCRTGEKPRSSWADGRASIEVGLAARESCDTGQAVEL
jgi:predicted dehydrogenase